MAGQDPVDRRPRNLMSVSVRQVPTNGVGARVMTPRREVVAQREDPLDHHR